MISPGSRIALYAITNPSEAMKGSLMSKKISRRDFIKLSGLSAAAAAVLTGCGPASRHVTRNPYATMPEYNQTGVSTYFATTCRDCHAGCGLIVRTKEGRAINIQGNPDHPVNRGKLCPRGVTGLQGLYNPDRIEGPRRYARRGEADYSMITWDEAVNLLAETLVKTNPEQIAFLLGASPDHLYDFVTEMAASLGAPPPIRLNTLAVLDQMTTLQAASEAIYGRKSIPFFDLANADVTLSFGASFLETWLSPLTYSRAYGAMRQGNFGKRGYLIALEPRLSMTAGNADEWLPVSAGTEGLAALGIAKQVAAIRGDRTSDEALSFIDLEYVSSETGVETERLKHVAELFAAAEHPLAIPGSAALAHENGLANGTAILSLNELVGNAGMPGGVFFAPNMVEFSTPAEVQRLIIAMAEGNVKTLFVHGCNPLFELPDHFGFRNALEKVETVINFAAYPNETTLLSDLVLPDHTAFESWGYQRGMIGADRQIISSFQPVVVPIYNTKASLDVLLAAYKTAYSEQPGNLTYLDEVDFIQKKLLQAQADEDGIFSAPEILTFWSQFLQYGGWWKKQAGWLPPKSNSFPAPIMDDLKMSKAIDGRFRLIIFPSPILADGSTANRPWLQETPDPTTTVTWGNCLEIHPETAHRLGIEDDDLVRVRSSVGEIVIPAYLYPGIRPDTVGIAFGQGHNALGRWAKDRGANPFNLAPTAWNKANDLALGETLVQITPTGQKRPLARLESREGVYGEGH